MDRIYKIYMIHQRVGIRLSLQTNSLFPSLIV